MEFPKQNHPQQKAPASRTTHSAYGTTNAITPDQPKQEAHVPDDLHPINPKSSEADNGSYHYLEQSVQYNVHRNPSSSEARTSDYVHDIKPRFSEAGNGSYHHFEQAVQCNVQQNPNSSEGVNDVRDLENLHLQYQAIFAELNNGCRNSAGSLGVNGNEGYPPGLRFSPYDHELIEHYLKRVNGNKGYPPGFRFSPYDHELIEHYLKRKIENPLHSWDHIKEVNLYDFDLKELKEEEGPEWYFFTPRDKKYPNGQRPNRATTTGYWKATGADRSIVLEDKINGERKEKKIIGKRKPLVFYETKSQNSHENKKENNKKTEWIMYEYQVHDPTASNQNKRKTENDMRLDDFVLCKISKTGRSFKSQEHEGSGSDQVTSMIGSSTFHNPSIPPQMQDNVQASSYNGLPPTAGDNVQARDVGDDMTVGISNFQDNVQASSSNGLPPISGSGDNIRTMGVAGNFQAYFEPTPISGDNVQTMDVAGTWAQQYDIWDMAAYQDFTYNFHGHGMSYGFAPPMYNYAFIPHFPAHDDLSATTCSDPPRFTDKDLTSSMDYASPSKKDNPSD